MERLINKVVDPEDATEDTDEDDGVQIEDIVTNGLAADMLEKCLIWYERQEEATAPSLLLLLLSAILPNM